MIPDTEAILARWHEMGEPEVPIMDVATTVADMAKFLDFYGKHPDLLPDSWMERIRQQLGLDNPGPQG